MLSIICSAICGICIGVCLMYVWHLNYIRKYRNTFLEGDDWNHKGTLHILRTPEADFTKLETYIELNNSNSLAEISKNNQVIFDVDVRDS